MQREKQAREDAERREKELHERLQRFQDEAKAAQDGKWKISVCILCACMHTYMYVHFIYIQIYNIIHIIILD